MATTMADTVPGVVSVIAWGSFALLVGLVATLCWSACRGREPERMVPDAEAIERRRRDIMDSRKLR